MRKVERICLIGPDALAAGAASRMERQDAACLRAGFQPVRVDLGAGRKDAERSDLTARILYTEALAEIRSCDVVVANLTPLRGPSCDASTAFLVGFAAALGKPVYGYLTIADEDDAEERDRIAVNFGVALGDDGVWRDQDGHEIEDFGLPVPALVWAETRRIFIVVADDPWRDITGLELCLEAVQAYADWT